MIQTSHQRPTTKKRVVRQDIQALRAVAVVAVLIYHVTPWLLPGGYVGVDIFFVVSGFVITTLMVTELRDTGQLRFASFYARRVRRILPAATVTIGTVVILGLFLTPLNEWLGIAQDGLFSAIFGQNWHLAHTSVDYLAGDGAPSPMQHFWSLSIEEQFYFLWPAALVAAFIAGRRKSVTFAAWAILIPTIAISLGLSIVAGNTGDASAYFTTHTRAWQLAAGALLAVGWNRVNAFTANTGGGLEPGQAPLTWRTGTLFYGGLALIGYAALTFSETTVFPGSAALLPTLGTAAVIASGIPAGRWATAGVTQWLGRISYSLYLVHWPVVIFLPESLPTPAWIGLALTLSLLLAHLSHRYVEVRLPQWLSKRTGARGARTLAAGGVLVLLGVAISGGGYAGSLWKVSELDAQAEELQAQNPPGFGSGSVFKDHYVDLLPDTRGTAPSRASVREDLPASNTEGCVGENDDSSTPDCSFGPTDGEETWVLVGDSHMDQYLPAFADIAEENNITLITFLHANCPYNAEQTTQDLDLAGSPCQQANEQTTEEINDLDPDLVITTNWSDREWDGDPTEGFVKQWEELEAPIIVLGDNPAMLGGDQTTACVVDNYPDTEACSIPVQDALPVDYQRIAAERTKADIELIDLTDLFCTDSECPPVIGNVMVYRDAHHLTATYTETLAPELYERVEHVR